MQLIDLKGIGKAKEKKLNKLGIFLVQDLLMHFPREYEDRSQLHKLVEADEKPALYHITITTYPHTRRYRKNQAMTRFNGRDETGFCQVTFFHHPFQKIEYLPNDDIYLFGKAKRDGVRLFFSNPIISDSLTEELGKIYPLYPLTEGIFQKEMHQWIEEAYKNIGNTFEENLPCEIIDSLNLLPKKLALKKLHFPQDTEDIRKARERIAFEELFYLQLGLLYLKTIQDEDGDGIQFKNNVTLTNFTNRLPYQLTEAQTRVLEEVWKDMESTKRMNRLIQGDVGSGKTVIAFAAAEKACFSGYQAVMMAPTEILAKQHFETAKSMLHTDLTVDLLLGSTTTVEKTRIYDDLRKGKIDFLISTHAAFQEDVEFHRLGLAIVDEQHRFGVKQRLALFEKGERPDVLVMSATPIPRTLAIILYGDMDLSVLDELPPGRQKVHTYVVGIEMEKRVANFALKMVAAGNQVYIVTPLIEESEKMDLQAAEKLYERLSKTYFKQCSVALIHGKMKSQEKEKIMAAFQKGEIQILISTTVIEVGVNVPKANLMLIYNAERFGLAQLHQLRGRVGRSSDQAYCVLFHMHVSKRSNERMEIIRKSNDGFWIAQKDMEMRGMGDVLGTRQSGLPDFKIADITLHEDLLMESTKWARKIIEWDPKLDTYPMLKKNIKTFFALSEHRL